MGCLEVLFELLIEGILELVTYVYFKLMLLIVPKKELSKQTETKIRNVITTISVVLFLVLILGAIFCLVGVSPWGTIGKYMTVIPLSIIGVQLLLGIIATVVRIVKKRKQ